jgi:hypothetical protein
LVETWLAHTLVKTEGDANMSNEALTVGTNVKIAKGCKAFDLPKGVSARVIDVKELGKDFGYRVSVTLKILNGFKAGHIKTLEARHVNRLSDAVVRLSHARPSEYIEIVRHSGYQSMRVVETVK